MGENRKEKKSKKGLIIIVIVGILLIGTLFVLNSQGISVQNIISNKLDSSVSAQVEEGNANITITKSTETVCRMVDGRKVCNLVLYSGIRFVEEDKQWKKVEDARSLKDKGFNIISVKDDGAHKIEVVDFNMSYIELSFSYDKDNLGEFEFEIEEGKMKTKFKIVETLFNETTLLPYDVETEQEIEIEEDTQRNIILNGNPFSKEFKLGEDSTTIMLQDPDTENLGDTWLDRNAPDTNNDESAGLLVNCNYFFDPPPCQSFDKTTWIKFNITSIPSGQIIDDATLAFWQFLSSTAEEIIAVYNSTNQTWDETIITSNNPPTGTDAVINTSIVNPSTNLYIFFGVTTAISNYYTSGYSNASFKINYSSGGLGIGFGLRWNDKEDTHGDGNKPYLNITYSPEPAPVVNLDSPSNNTFSNVLNQYFNSSYTATAGDLVNSTLSIWNSTSNLVYNTTESVSGSSNSSSINFTFTYDDAYIWNYNVCDDSVLCASNDTNFTITIDTTAPTFDNLADQIADANSSFSFDINATDVTSSVSCFTVNDTTNFQIDCSGVLQNNTILSVQIYNLNITANDTANNLVTGVMSVNVTVWDTILKWDWAALTTDKVSPDQICFVYRDGEYCFDETGRVKLVGNATISRSGVDTRTFISESGNLITIFGD